MTNLWLRDVEKQGLTVGQTFWLVKPKCNSCVQKRMDAMAEPNMVVPTGKFKIRGNQEVLEYAVVAKQNIEEWVCCDGLAVEANE